LNVSPGTLEGDVLSLGEKRVRLSHEDKVYFPAVGLTKGDVLDYYRGVAPYLLPHLADRPLVMERWPEGVVDGHFYQKDAPAYFPEWLKREAVHYPHSGKTDHHPLVSDVADLLYLVNLGTLTLHTFLSRTDDLDHPDILVIDLDPPEEAADAEGFRLAVHSAFLVREELGRLGLEPFVKTSGKRGLHLALPLDRRLDYQQARESLTQLFERLSSAYPDRLTRDIRKAKRGGRVYLDALRMALGATVVPAYVVRATPSATVSMPVTWDELPGLESGAAFDITNAPARLARTGDLWAALTPAAAEPATS
jgi:bifunctional non-homologous end joining protein LigD